MRIVTEALGGTGRGYTALVVAPPTETTDEDGRLGLLEGAEQGDQCILAITCKQSAQSFFEEWRERFDTVPLDLAVIDVGETTRSATSQSVPPRSTLQANAPRWNASHEGTSQSSASHEGTPQSSASHEGTPQSNASGTNTVQADTDEGGAQSNTVHGGNAIRAVADPAALESILEAVTRTLEQLREIDGDTVVYLDSLSPVLERTSLVAAVEFLSALSAVVRRAGANGYVCLDTPIDSTNVEALSAVVDARIDIAGTRVMNVEPIESSAGIDRPGVDTTFELLRARRRRLVLYHLLESDSTIDVRTLANRIARTEGGSAESSTVTDEKRVYTDLVNRHLPALAEVGVVDVDWSSKHVTLLEPVSALEPFLALAAQREPGGAHVG